MRRLAGMSVFTTRTSSPDWLCCRKTAPAASTQRTAMESAGAKPIFTVKGKSVSRKRFIRRSLPRRMVRSGLVAG